VSKEDWGEKGPVGGPTEIYMLALENSPGGKKKLKVIAKH